MADHNKRNPNEKQPGGNPKGEFHYNPGNMAGKKPGDPEETAENRGELPHDNKVKPGAQGVSIDTTPLQFLSRKLGPFLLANSPLLKMGYAAVATTAPCTTITSTR